MGRAAESRPAPEPSDAATKNAGRTGSELIDAIILQVQQLKHELGCPVASNSQPKPPMVMETLVEIISSPSRPVRQSVTPAVEPVRAVPSPVKARNGSRSPIASAHLEAAITEAIRKRAPGCESLIGVIVQQTRPRSRFDANWEVRGVKFGRADRDKVSEAIAGIVESMQREYSLSDD